MTKKKFIIPIDVYAADVFVVVGSRDDLFAAIERLDIKSIENIKDEMENVNYDGYTISENSGQLVIWVDGKLDDWQIVNVLNHEIYHAVQAMYRNIGVYPSSTVEECFAYLHEYLFKKAMQKLCARIEFPDKNNE